MLCLIMRRGPTPGAIYELASDEITIGRGSKNRIVINDNDVSREHCRLLRLVDDYEVHDLNSHTGTFVNGQRVVSSWLLSPGALIELGDTITLEYGSYNPDEAGVLSPDEAEDAAHQLNPDATYGLMMTMGPAVGYLYELDRALVKVGRDTANHIVIQDPEVSRFHLQLHYGTHGYTIEDLSSTNGTFINGSRLRQRHLLQPNDVIKLGTMIQLQFIHQQKRQEKRQDKPPAQHQGDFPYIADLADEETLATLFEGGDRAPVGVVSSLGTGVEPEMLSDHIFVAYSREDWETVVAPLVISLQDAGLKPWVDQYLVEGSEVWRAAVEQALAACWLMVVVLSPPARSSPYTRMEYRYFLNAEKPVIPMICDGAVLPGELARSRALTFNASGTRRSFHKLIYTILELRRSRHAT